MLLTQGGRPDGTASAVVFGPDRYGPFDKANPLDYTRDYYVEREGYADMTPLETLLTSEIAELKAELANRPIVWAIEHIKEKTLVKRFGAVMLFQTKEDVEEYIPTGFSWPHCWHAVVYKGVARWFDNSRPEDDKNERLEHGTT